MKRPKDQTTRRVTEWKRQIKAGEAFETSEGVKKLAQMTEDNLREALLNRLKVVKVEKKLGGE